MHITDDSLQFESFSSSSLYAIRLILAVMCPNVALKRVLFNFRMKSSKYCTNTLSKILKIKYDQEVSYWSFSEPGISMFISILVSQILFSLIFLVIIETQTVSKRLIQNTWVNWFNKNKAISAGEDNVRFSFKILKYFIRIHLTAYKAQR
jgi:hypothetical protein